MSERPALLHGPSRLKKNRDLYDRNAAESPLLRLPAEIRNQIWGYIFCSSLVLVQVPSVSESPTYRFCDETKDQSWLVEKVKGGNYAIHSKHIEENWTYAFISSYKVKRRLDILRLCRQIHAEAALLPFSRSCFSFDSGTALCRFMERMVPEQVRAIKRISVATQAGQCSPPRTENLQNFERLVRDRLPNIEHLTIFVEVHQVRAAKRFAWHKQTRADWAEAMMPLRCFSLRSMKVALWCSRNIPRMERIPDKMARAWEADLEKKILGPWHPLNDVTANGRREERNSTKGQMKKRVSAASRFRHAEMIGLLIRLFLIVIFCAYWMVFAAVITHGVIARDNAFDLFDEDSEDL